VNKNGKSDPKKLKTSDMKSAPIDRCPRCSVLLSATDSRCIACGSDIGAPNVRECSSETERKALKQRLQQAEKLVRSEKREQPFNELSDLLKRKSGVVVAMPASLARDFVSDRRKVYANLETLVSVGVRQAPALVNDRHRKAVAGLLFGTYGDKLRYGALSLDNSGLPTYGDVFCRLRDIMISHRTSFLESNSYAFVRQHKISPGTSPPEGYRSVWDNRHLLALVKLANRVTKGQNAADWQDMLCYSDGRDRANDDIVEAHIFDGFNIDAVEEMVGVKSKCNRNTTIEMRLALELFTKNKSGSGK
jgi:hypothetical protein